MVRQFVNRYDVFVDLVENGEGLILESFLNRMHRLPSSTVNPMGSHLEGRWKRQTWM